MHHETVILGPQFQRRSWFLSRQSGRIGRVAEPLHRTGAAFWAHSADERAELHQRGIMLASVPVPQELRGLCPKLFAPGAGVDRHLQIEETRQNASDIRFNDGN